MNDVVAKVVSVKNDKSGRYLTVFVPWRFEVSKGDIVRLKVIDDAELIKREFAKVIEEVIS